MKRNINVIYTYFIVKIQMKNRKSKMDKTNNVMNIKATNYLVAATSIETNMW